MISMHSGTTTTIQDPKNPEHRKTFIFDLAYWSHDGFQKDQDGVLISADPSSQFASQVTRFKTQLQRKGGLFCFLFLNEVLMVEQYNFLMQACSGIYFHLSV